MSFLFFSEACSRGHVFYREKNGDIFGFGRNNSHHQLGFSDSSNKFKPVKVFKKFPRISKKIKYIKTGYKFSIILTFDHQTYGLGDNSDGQLSLGNFLFSPNGFGDICENLSYIKTFKGAPVLDVSCGNKHSMFLLDDGVYASGSNRKGQLGTANGFTKIYSAEKMNFNFSGIKVKTIAAGAWYSLFLTQKGDTYYAGMIGTENRRVSRFRINTIFQNLKIERVFHGSFHLFASDSTSVYAMGSNKWLQLSNEISFGQLANPQKLTKYKSYDIADVKCGHDFSLFLLKNGNVIGFGKSMPMGKDARFSSGGIILNNIVQIRTSQTSCYLFDKFGTVFVGGNNLFGQLGIGETNISNGGFVLLQENKYIKNLGKEGDGDYIAFKSKLLKIVQVTHSFIDIFIKIF